MSAQYGDLLLYTELSALAKQGEINFSKDLNS